MKRYFLIGLIILISLFSENLLAAHAALTHIQLSSGDASARLEFSLSQPVSYKIFTLPNPSRLVVDLPDTQLNASLPSLNHSLITQIRSGHPKPLTLRLVFDLNSSVTIKTFKQSTKIIVDIYAGKQETKKIIPTQSSTISSISKTPKIVAPKQNNKIFVIVIDPGHGGKDPGAVGEQGVQEKDVVLAISKRLAYLINQQTDMRAELTRTGDYFVPLRQRLRLARKGKADLFIAIHADSFFNGRSTGASVYALSHRGATSEAARWLAARENTSELGGVDLAELEDKSYMLRSVLIDLAQTATITDSLRLGNALLDSLDRVTRLHYTRVEQAPFVVLKSPDIPSVLVETGFISNPKEEQKLQDNQYQDKIARALLSGIQSYLKKYAIASV